MVKFLRWLTSVLNSLAWWLDSCADDIALGKYHCGWCNRAGKGEWPKLQGLSLTYGGWEYYCSEKCKDMLARFHGLKH